MTNPKLAAIIDPLDTLNPDTDTGLALLYAAHQAGLQTFAIQGLSLSWQDQQVYAPIQALSWENSLPTAGTSKLTPLDTLDVVLMRKDPPVDTHYVSQCQLLASVSSVYVSNAPDRLIQFNEKLCVCHPLLHEHTAPLIPPMMVSRHIADLQTMLKQHQTIVVKPLNLMGGQNIFVVQADDPNRQVIFETLTQQQTQSVMAQPYLEAIRTEGDLRVLAVAGQIVPHGLVRMPGKHDHRGNLSKGASAAVRALTDAEQARLAPLAKRLHELGIDFAGLDLIGEHLTEINITAPTGAQQIAQATGVQAADLLLTHIQATL